MGEYILRPRSHNFKAGYEYDDANHKTNLAYDNDPETYWLATNSGSNSKRMLYNFDFDKIPNGENIVGAKLSIVYISDGGYSHCNLTKAISTSDPSYSNQLGETWYPPINPKEQIKTKSLDLDISGTGVKNPLEYIQNNISSLRAGSAVFGVWIYPGANPSSPFKLYDISLTVYTEETTKLFIGESPVTSAYLGNTKLSGIYLGSNKLL